VLAKDVLLAVLPDLDTVGARLEEKGEAGTGEEVDAALGVGGVRLEEIEVVKLAEALVDAAADAAQGDDVGSGRLRLANPGDGLAKVGRLLVGVVDDFGGGMLGGVEVVDVRPQGVEVADDDLEV
jgi:hypothetical protein